MEQTIFTPRLKLTLVTTAERGSPELEWLHELRSDEKSTWWSLSGRSKTLEDTEKVMKKVLPVTTNEGEAKIYRVVYAVHEILSSATPSSADSAKQQSTPTRIIGMVTIHSIGPNSLVLPFHLFPPSCSNLDCLTVEVGYQYLPAAWGKGYATESVSAAFEACQSDRGKAFWEPYKKLFVRGVVNSENPASQQVMGKIGMAERGVHVWEGDRIWIGGRWRTTDTLYIFGKFLVE
ncbi:hypothetical protein EJ02DRAFT_405123 [Clathrospora elynae]|uniref:N-acetyltransferase domain-containing protein n=1 Tax=Clathrospora elynae TaxID=706981 RepID=A0A6A5SKQ8_9PLEO|nr:hypothetical protein EJ02DRAFT_405123 [Clathrospora elynae]